MSYVRKIEKVIQYIELNLNEEIRIEDLADLCHLSKFYFHRIFTALTGDSIMDYIRKRRISMASLELINSDKTILEIAMDYGFGSQEAFTRSFKNICGINPGAYRKGEKEIEIYEKFNVWKLKNEGGFTVEPKFVVKQEFKVIGLEIKTTMKENEEEKTIPKLWDKYAPRMSEIKNVAVAKRDLGLCEVVGKSDDSFSYIACKEVENFDFVPEGMSCKTIPTTKYAVFTHTGKVDKLGETYQYIYGTWLMNSGYHVEEGSCDFELYDDRFDNSETSEMDIYVPIK